MALVLIFIPFLLIAKQPDLGTALLILASGIFCFISQWLIMENDFFCTIRSSCFRFQLTDICCMIISGGFKNSEHGHYRFRCLGTRLEHHSVEAAIGAGGLTGQGYLAGTQLHLHFLPEGHTDFDYCSIFRRIWF